MIFYDSVSSGASLSARPRSKKVSRNRYLLFLYLWRKFTCRQRCGNKRCRRAAFCAVGLQGPLRRAEGMGVKRSDHRERSSQSLSPLDHNAERMTKVIRFVFVSMSECKQKGWALSGVTNGSAVANPSLRSNTKQNGRPHGHPFFLSRIV